MIKLRYERWLYLISNESYDCFRFSGTAAPSWNSVGQTSLIFCAFRKTEAFLFTTSSAFTNGQLHWVRWVWYLHLRMDSTQQYCIFYLRFPAVKFSNMSLMIWFVLFLSYIVRKRETFASFSVTSSTLRVARLVLLCWQVPIEFSWSLTSTNQEFAV